MSRPRRVNNALRRSQFIALFSLRFIVMPPARCFLHFASRRRREMYCGHARLCVCTRLHAHAIARTRM